MKPRKPLQIRAVGDQSPGNKPAGMSGREVKPVDTSFAVAPARREAFAILVELEKASAASAAHSDDLLRGAAVSALSVQDRHLTTTLVMGTLRWQMLLDAQIRPLLSKPYGRMDAEVRIALRLGAFQLLHLDRIPPHAAIGESVALAKRAGQKFASGMVNAVLRKLALQRETSRDSSRDSQPKEAESAVALAEQFAHPAWLVERWVARYGFEQAKAICEHGQSQAILTVRLASPELEREVAEQGLELAPALLLSAARSVVSGDVTETDAFRSGRLRMQDEGSQLIAELAGHGKRILDACAAPGGKTLILAERNPEAEITAMEISAARLEALRKRFAEIPGAERIRLQQGDSGKLPENAGYDLALVDVPCSGTGTLGRNPEIRHRLKPEDLQRHHRDQCSILRGVLLACSAPRARVLYSTCSLEPEENDAVIARVLDEVSGWRRVSLGERMGDLVRFRRVSEHAGSLLAKTLSADGSLTLLPGMLGSAAATDGFFAAMLERVE